jgi:SAM-dependent methyltransferase
MAQGELFAPTGPLRRAAYRWLWTAADGLQKAANACLYLAAGLLRPEELRAASRHCWEAYNAASRADDSGLDAWERRFYGAWVRPGNRVLLVGCGSGRDLVGLIELGCQVTGLDASRVAVARAADRLSRRGIAAPLLTSDVETAELEASYDVVIFAPVTYAYIPQHAARVRTLARLRAHVQHDGRVLLTYLERRGPSPRSLRLVQWAGRLVGHGWHPEPGDCLAREFSAPRLLRYEHHFTPEEIARECEAAGLCVVHDEALTGQVRGLVASVDRS